MSDSGPEIQKAKENIAAADKSTLKERLKKTIVDELSKLDENDYLTLYDRKKNKKIRAEACIYRVPDQLRGVKTDAYRPSVVSIGPFHADDPNLAPMIRYKRSYMLSFIEQLTKDAKDVIANQDVEDARADQDAEEAEDTKRARESLENCIDAVDGLDKGIRQCYTETIKYKEDKLAEMMLLDGCFILELFLRYDRSLNYIEKDDYDSDPVLRSAWTIADLQRDLALLENQIPYFVLEFLYDAIKSRLKINEDKRPDSVASLALKFFQPLSQKNKKEKPEGTEFKHLLDLLHKFYFNPTDHFSIRMPGPQRETAVTGKWEVKYCASDLMKSGIEFNVGSNADQSLLEITFSEGLISIPQLHIHETANSLLRNLIAFEQCSLKSTHSVTSYVFLLKGLISTTADGKRLEEQNIIIQHNNQTGDDDYFTQLDSMLDQVALKDDFYFGALLDKVNEYRKSWQVQEQKDIAAADKSTLKERLKKTIVDELMSKLNENEYLTLYDRKKNKKIRAEACIYRVPDQLRGVKTDAYRPSVVSIGPFHADNPNLAPMIRYKRSYMLSFIEQLTKDAKDVIANQDVEDARADQDAEEAEDTKRARESLENCIDAVDGLDKGIRQCYTETIKYKEDKLAEMMLLDGCFILELFLRYDRSLNYIEKEDYDSDPVLSSAWTTAALKRDLALLENQIPYFVLELLYDAIKFRLKINEDKRPDSVASLALKFFQPLSQKNKNVKPEGTEFKHLLDLLHKFYFHPTDHLSIHIEENPENRHHSAFEKIISCLLSKIKRICKPGPQRETDVTGKLEGKYCASDLMKSGIDFNVESNADQSLLKITFNEGFVSIPQLLIHETANSLLRNLIAFEQCSLKSTHSVTSYVFLLKCFITTTADSKLLGGKNIIIQHNNQTGHDDFCTQLDSMLDRVTLKDDFYFGALLDNVNEYRKSWRSRRRLKVFLRVQVLEQVRILRKTYCSSVWKFVSVIAAVVLLILTSVQTYFTIHPVK